MDKKIKAKLDKVFSRYIRLRDTNGDGRTFTCISCGKVKPVEQMDAGHFWNRIHLATRWDERNVWGECRYCNRFDENHLLAYKNHLIERIGQRQYDILEMKHRMPAKWTDFEGKALIDYYTREVKAMEEKRGFR